MTQANHLASRVAQRAALLSHGRVAHLWRQTLLLIVIFGAWCSMIQPTTAQAQNTQTAARPDRGITPGSAYSVSDIESISLSNGNLNLSIPLASLPPMAGGKLGLTLRATYNSKLWDVVSGEARYRNYTNNPIYVAAAPRLGDRGGWHIGASYAVIFRNAQEDFGYLQTNQSEDPDWQQLQSP